MTEKLDIHDFAYKWILIFQNPMTRVEEINDMFPEACFSLGFQLKVEDLRGGVLIREEALSDIAALFEEINRITDTEILGSIIFSMWNHLSQWTRTGLLYPFHRLWFITALGRMEIMTSKSPINPFLFRGKAKKITIISNSAVHEEEPKKGKEIQQLLKLSSEGEVVFEAYDYEDRSAPLKEGRSKKVEISKDSAAEILQKTTSHFKKEITLDLTDQISFWFLLIENEKGEVFQYSGYLYQEDSFMEDLSSFMRKELGIPGLLLFNGETLIKEKIERIKIEYRSSILEGDGHIKKDSFFSQFGDYYESLTIDREKDSLKHEQWVEGVCEIKKEFQVNQIISAFLDQWDYDFFNDIEGNSKDAIEEYNPGRNYTITIDFKKRPQHKILGSYDKNSLPKNWAIFINNILEFMLHIGLGDLFNPAIYNKRKRRESDYIYLGILFSNDKMYYYRTEDPTIAPGEYVVVPVGEEGRVDIREVAEIEYYQEEDLPYPLEKTKMILRKSTQEEFEAFKKD
ncbi:MAG: hypothetical protein Q4G11_00685 [Gallicola sp.]|nr:hypothetical protein [Gallicola sp.]